MANLSITATEVLKITGSTVINTSYNFGEQVTQGEVVYLDSSDSELKLADASDAALDVVFGIALNAGEDGQPAAVATGGTVTIGASASMSVGKVYVLSTTAGAIMPIDDAVASGTVYASIIGVAISASVLQIGIINSGVEYAADVS